LDLSRAVRPKMKILLISYYFPPFNTVGAVRPGKLAKYLERRGHDVHVLTAAEPPFPKGLELEIATEYVHTVHAWSINAPIHWLLGGRAQTSRSGFQALTKGRNWLQRAGYWYKTLVHWPDAEVGWANASIRLGKELLRKEEFDLIYVSAPSFSGLRVGSQLSRYSTVPWVAEFRDLWAANHAYSYPAWRRWIERKWERSLLRSASALVTVSAPLAASLQHHGKPVWEIRNGFDPDDIDKTNRESNAKTGELRIVYTGSVYFKYHDVDTFCQGLKGFVALGGNAVVEVVGRNIEPLWSSAIRHQIENHFCIRPVVPRADAISMQCSADVLLMFLWQGGSNGVYTTKLFEYAGAQREVLAVGSHSSDVAAMVLESQLGRVASNAEEVTQHLLQWSKEKACTGVVAHAANAGGDMTRDAQFSRLEANLEKLIRREVQVN